MGGYRLALEDRAGIRERIESRMTPEPNTGCWLWIGAMYASYGCIAIEGRHYRAHRLSAYASLGLDIYNPKQLACHRCDTPACVNPMHLFIGTHAENMKDMLDKERVAHGEDAGNNRFAEGDVLEILALVANGADWYDVAKEFDATEAVIRGIIVSDRWKYLKREVPELWNRAKASYLTRKHVRLCKPVLCISTGERFPSGKDAAAHFGMTRSEICMACKGKKAHVRGLIFRYAEPE